MSDTKDNSLTITLTGRPPVKIDKDAWPIIASATDKNWDNQYESQANRTAQWKLIVRQNKDGRTLVYAIYSYSSQWQDESDVSLRGGELVPASAADTYDLDEVLGAIQRVGEEIEGRFPKGLLWGTGVFPRLIHECIARLPAEEI